MILARRPSSTPSRYMLLDTRWSERGEDGFALYHLRLAHVFRRRARARSVTEERCVAGTTPMSLPQLLTLIQLPVELVPRGLHDRVQFGDVSATLIVDAVHGVLTCVAGFAVCGVSSQDKLLFFNRPSAVTSSLFGSRQTRSVIPQLNEVVYSPINRWCSLQCRSVLDTAVFPHIHMHSAHRCLAPLFQYVLCETEGNVELSQKATREFRAGHGKLADYSKLHAAFPSQLRPTSALFALQPHLPSGYWEIPASALIAPSSYDSLIQPEFTSSLSPLTVSSSASHAIVGISEADADVLHHVASYLDMNSILFGFIPAVHSLPSATIAFNDDTYGRPMLLSRYGALCDAALWEAELLCEWRLDKLSRDAAELCKQLESATFKNRPSHSPSHLLAWNDSLRKEMSRAVHRNIHWAAIFDLQTRINKYVIRVMLQRKEDVLPQLYQTPTAVVQHRLHMAKYWSHTVRPTYLTLPDAATALLMCVPPFHAVPTHNDTLATGEERSRSRSYMTVQNVSPHVVDFADIYTRGHTVLSLYMGPVYVMADAQTAGRGVEVGVVVPRTRKNPLGFAPLMYRNRRRNRMRREDTVVRQLYMDDVNQLLVTARLDDNDSIGVMQMNETMSASFERLGVTALIEQTRAEWKRVAKEHRSASAGNDEAGEQDDQEPADDAATIRHGPVTEYWYVRELMMELLDSLRRSMGEKR